MWQRFLALPLVARIVTLAAAAVLALWGAIKAKAIRAALKKAREASSAWFWNWVGGEMERHHPQERNGNEKTYKGIFQDYWYTSNPRDTHLFRLTHNGVTTTVPVLETSLFYGLKKGTFVEIDTEAIPGYAVESVKRLRVRDT